MFLLTARVLWRWEPVGLVDFIGFRCFQKALYVMNSIVRIVIQKVPHLGRIVWWNVFCLFRSQYRVIRYVRSLLEGVRVVQKVSNLDHMFVILSGRQCWTDKKVFVALPKWPGLNYSCRFLICVNL